MSDRSKKGPKWLDETQGQRSHALGKRGEKDALGKMGATPVARSGAGRTKGDGRKRMGEYELHIEHKTTEAAGFSISGRIMDKLVREAGATRLPLLSITFAKRRPKTTWVAMPLHVFHALTEQDIGL